MKRDNMNIWALVSREIRYRKAGFVIGLICVAVAIGSLVGAVTLLNAHETHTETVLEQRARETDNLLARKERETREEMDRLEDDYRRIMRDMGHNVLILHEDQSLARLRSAGYPDTTMPEDYAYRLGEGYIETLNHLLPVLQERIPWPEHDDLEIILTGTPGQVPVSHLSRFLTEDGEAYRNPIVDPIPEGGLKVGHAVARELNLRPGDTVSLRGEEFKVHEIQPPQGDQEDIMVWCNLEVAQRWLEKEGRINAIFALECICDIDALGQIMDEVEEILPDVQVLEFSSRVKARGEARQRAEEEARRSVAAEIEQREKMLAGEIEHREEVLNELHRLASILVPVVLLASGLWIFFLVLGNVREREAEIGILRAIGVRESKIMAVFLSRAVIIGLIGAVFGYFGGIIVGVAWSEVPVFSTDFFRMFNPLLFIAALFTAAILCAVAGWLPALKAANSDPADVLRQD